MGVGGVVELPNNHDKLKRVSAILIQLGLSISLLIIAYSEAYDLAIEPYDLA